MVEHAVNLEQVIAAEPVIVWSVITDIDGAPRLYAGVRSVERLGAPEEYEVGTRWRQRRRVLRREYDQEWVVAGCDYPRRVEIRTEANGLAYRSVHELSPEGTGTLVRNTYWVSLSGGSLQRALTHRVGLPVVLRVLEHVMRADLGVVAAESIRRQRIS